MQQLFLFGLPGVGKTYIGKMLQEQLNFRFWDGDNALSEEMKDFIRLEKPFTQEMTAQLSKNIISTIEKIIEEEMQSKEGHSIVIAQAMLLEEDRQKIQERFPEMQFIQVVSDNETANRRIDERNDWVSVTFANNIRCEFDKVKEQADQYPKLINNHDGEAEIVKQLKYLIGFDFDKKVVHQESENSTKSGQLALLISCGFWQDDELLEQSDNGLGSNISYHQ